jgi:hypothetical protein
VNKQVFFKEISEIVSLLVWLNSEDSYSWFFQYYGHTELFEFHASLSKKNYNNMIAGSRHEVSLDAKGARNDLADMIDYLNKRIFFIQNNPSHTTEEDPDITVTIKKSEAEKLGKLCQN